MTSEGTARTLPAPPVAAGFPVVKGMEVGRVPATGRALAGEAGCRRWLGDELGPQRCIYKRIVVGESSHLFQL